MKRTLDYNKPFKLKGRKYKAKVREARAISKSIKGMKQTFIRNVISSEVVFIPKIDLISYEEALKMAGKRMRMEGVRIQEVKNT